MFPSIYKKKRYIGSVSCGGNSNVCQASKIAKDLVSQLRENDFKFLKRNHHKNDRKFFGQYMQVENMVSDQKIQLVHFTFSTPPTYFDVDGIPMEPPKGFTAQWSYNQNDIVREYNAFVDINPGSAYASTYTEINHDDDDIESLLEENEIDQIINNL